MFMQILYTFTYLNISLQFYDCFAGKIRKIDEEDEAVIDASEESEEIAESTEQTQVESESPAADTEPESESEIQSDVPAAITETKIKEDEEDPEDSGNAESELAETPNVESPDSEEDKQFLLTASAKFTCRKRILSSTPPCLLYTSPSPRDS